MKRRLSDVHNWVKIILDTSCFNSLFYFHNYALRLNSALIFAKLCDIWISLYDIFQCRNDIFNFTNAVLCSLLFNYYRYLRMISLKFSSILCNSIFYHEYDTLDIVLQCSDGNKNIWNTTLSVLVKPPAQDSTEHGWLIYLGGPLNCLGY